MDFGKRGFSGLRLVSLSLGPPNTGSESIFKHSTVLEFLRSFGEANPHPWSGFSVGVGEFTGTGSGLTNRVGIAPTYLHFFPTMTLKLIDVQPVISSTSEAVPGGRLITVVYDPNDVAQHLLVKRYLDVYFGGAVYAKSIGDRKIYVANPERLARGQICCYVDPDVGNWPYAKIGVKFSNTFHFAKPMFLADTGTVDLDVSVMGTRSLADRRLSIVPYVALTFTSGHIWIR
jgi:hypothetical protein